MRIRQNATINKLTCTSRVGLEVAVGGVSNIKNNYINYSKTIF